MVSELFNSSIQIKTIIATKSFLLNSPQKALVDFEILEATAEEIKKASLLQSPQEAIAICQIPDNQFDNPKEWPSLSIYLDNIQDPGNLGTILRVADWFGIESIFASKNTVDLYNPKVVQASMGAIFRVTTYYIDFEELLQLKDNDVRIYGTFLNGKNLYDEKFPNKSIVVMGNEGQGISPELESLIDHQINIPSFANNTESSSESLNVSMATAIVCSEIRRQQMK